jgi:hypothetical protein
LLPLLFVYRYNGGMTRKARIYQPSKNAMQSGRGNSHDWVLEHVSQSSPTPDNLMGWPTMSDTMQQVKLRFDSQEKALAYAKAKNIDVELVLPQTRHITPRPYADNFAHQRRK